MATKDEVGRLSHDVVDVEVRRAESAAVGGRGRCRAAFGLPVGGDILLGVALAGGLCFVLGYYLLWNTTPRGH